jgi:sedoheptulose-bisphosphatase
LLPEGEERIKSTANAVFGEGKLIQPSKLARIYCSPRSRATRTLELLLDNISDANSRSELEGRRDVTEGIGEWGYGDYEGLLTKEIRALRKSRGEDTESEWNIWRDGTEGEGSETPGQVRERLESIIGEIVQLQGQAMQEGNSCGDVLVVAHGHILRAFVKCWAKIPFDPHIEMMLEPGGVCGLSYAHSNVEERAILVGLSFPGH